MWERVTVGRKLNGIIKWRLAWRTWRAWLFILKQSKRCTSLLYLILYRFCVGGNTWEFGNRLIV